MQSRLPLFNLFFSGPVAAPCTSVGREEFATLPPVICIIMYWLVRSKKDLFWPSSKANFNFNLKVSRVIHILLKTSKFVVKYKQQILRSIKRKHEYRRRGFAFMIIRYYRVRGWLEKSEPSLCDGHWCRMLSVSLKYNGAREQLAKDDDITGKWRPSFWRTFQAIRVWVSVIAADEPVLLGHLRSVTLTFSNLVHARIMEALPAWHQNDRAVVPVILMYLRSLSVKNSGPWNRFTGRFGAFGLWNAYIVQSGSRP